MVSGVPFWKRGRDSPRLASRTAGRPSLGSGGPAQLPQQHQPPQAPHSYCHVGHGECPEGRGQVCYLRVPSTNRSTDLGCSLKVNGMNEFSQERRRIHWTSSFKLRAPRVTAHQQITTRTDVGKSAFPAHLLCTWPLSWSSGLLCVTILWLQSSLSAAPHELHAARTRGRWQEGTLRLTEVAYTTVKR